ncbi:MAG TPA: alpha/beta fold hydrolase [Acidimicrobiales bacterium]|nr:alpha/beta fold hydrolase [Acidimicrobiales bacterium]
MAAEGRRAASPPGDSRVASRVGRRADVTAAGLAATVIEPAGPWNGRVLYCLPGGGMSRRYFDLALPGYSMAEHLAGRGFVVGTIDHPAVGDSPVPADPWGLTPAVVADADAHAVRELHARLGGVPIGVGHSMGAMLTVTAQARDPLYAGLALLGYAHIEHYERTELAGVLTSEERTLLGKPDRIEAAVAELAKARFGRPLPKGTTTRSAFLLGGMPVPDEALDALDGCIAPLLACCGLASMLKCTSDAIGVLDVPVFIGFGQRDITGDARSTASALLRCPDITLFELPGAGHNHNVAPNRSLLWDRVASWAERVGVPEVTRPAR